VGVPGLLATLIDQKPWILVESERRKADYLQKAVIHFHLETQVQVIHQRIEVFLKSPQASEVLRSLQSNHFESVVVRAVGPVSRIYEWMRPCSTWNSLILFKGPKWDEEWNEFQMGRFKNELHLSVVHAYRIGVEQKSRQILRLERVVI
jgi:16S rRNA G527 N7-methylase RsmG